MRTFLMLFMFAFALTSRTGAADWPMGGRSSDRNSVSAEKNAPIDWEVGGDVRPRNVRWSVPLGSRSIGGPIVAGGLVWVGTNNERQFNPKLVRDHAILACFRESDGKFLYQYATPRLPDSPQDWSGQSLSGSPLVEGDRLWFCTNRREVVCLDVAPLYKKVEEPKVRWKFDMVKGVGVSPLTLMIPGVDLLGSPAVYKELLFVPTGNGMAVDGKTLPAPDAPALICLNKETGKLVWKYTPHAKGVLFGHYSSPLVIEVGGKGQVVMPQPDGWVRSFEAETGKPVWQFDVNAKKPKDDKKLYVVGTPVYCDGRVYFASGLHPEAATEPGRLFCVDPSKSGDITPVWEFSGDRKDGFMNCSLASVVVHSGLVVAADARGFVHCLDARTGERQWTHDGRHSVFGNPLVVDGKVYVGTQGDDVWILELNRTKKVIAKRSFDQSIIAGPVFANGTLYVLTEGRLYAIGTPAKP